MNNTFKIFVIIVTYKGRCWYDRCLGSLRESTIPVQTVVVDNTPGEEDAVYIKTHFPEVYFVKSNDNLGFGKANNIGMRHALENGCDYVFLLNQDAWVEPDTFEKMIGIHQRHQEYGILGCINVTKERNHMLDGFIWTITDPGNCSKSLVDDLYFSRLKEVYDVKSILAAAWLMPRKTMETVGGFDPVFFHYGEDDNYLQRVWYHGMKVGVCPKCTIVHDAQTARVPEAVEFRKKSYAREREWLLEWCDVNNPKMEKNQTLNFFWKAVKQFVQLDIKKAVSYWDRYKYYRKNRGAIINSLSINKTKGENYL